VVDRRLVILRPQAIVHLKDHLRKEGSRSLVTLCKVAPRVAAPKETVSDLPVYTIYREHLVTYHGKYSSRGVKSCCIRMSYFSSSALFIKYSR
jgi:hypothetical protein